MSLGHVWNSCHRLDSANCIRKFDKLDNGDEGRYECVSVALQLSMLDVT